MNGNLKAIERTDEVLTQHIPLEMLWSLSADEFWKMHRNLLLCNSNGREGLLLGTKIIRSTICRGE